MKLTVYNTVYNQLLVIAHLRKIKKYIYGTSSC